MSDPYGLDALPDDPEERPTSRMVTRITGETVVRVGDITIKIKKRPRAGGYFMQIESASHTPIEKL